MLQELVLLDTTILTLARVKALMKTIIYRSLIGYIMN